MGFFLLLGVGLRSDFVHNKSLFLEQKLESFIINDFQNLSMRNVRFYKDPHSVEILEKI